MSKEKQIEERNELSDIISYANRDYNDYVDECHNNGDLPIDDWGDWLADAVLNAGYRKQSEWISVDDRLPGAEVEVLVMIRRKLRNFDSPIITTAMYEDGTVSTEDSFWCWYDLDFDYDEENDRYLIPKGWWEYRHYNPDDVFNNLIDDEVTHWMPLPEPPKEERKRNNDKLI